MIKSYKIRLIPTAEQEQMMRDSMNAARFVWNWGLAYQMERFRQGEPHLSGYDMKKVLTEYKQQPGMEWLNSISTETLSMTLLDLANAYERFFAIQEKGEKYSRQTIERAKRQGRKLTFYDMQGHPKFKKKDKAKPSFYARYNQFYFTPKGVVLEKIGKVKYQTDYQLPIVNKKGQNTTKFTNPRVHYEGGKWMLSFGMEIVCNNQAPTLNGFAVVPRPN